MRILILFFLGFSAFYLGQTKQELDKVMLSKDPKEIASFIKVYPQNVNIPFLKKKLETLSPKSSAMNSYSNGGSAPKTSRTDPGAEAVLNHLFNNDPTKTEAYLQIKNQSDCDIKLRIEGKKAFLLTINKRSENYILIPKGYYNLSSEVCNASYFSTKNIKEDTQIILGGGIKKSQK